MDFNREDYFWATLFLLLFSVAIYLGNPAP